MFPFESLIGEIVRERSRVLPSLAILFVSKCSTFSPLRSLLRISGSSSMRSAGIKRVIGWPSISSSVYPNNFSAPWFQLVIIPLSVFPMIASPEDWTMAASFAHSNSANLASVTSTNILKAPVTSPFELKMGSGYGIKCLLLPSGLSIMKDEVAAALRFSRKATAMGHLSNGTSVTPSDS